MAETKRKGISRSKALADEVAAAGAAGASAAPKKPAKGKKTAAKTGAAAKKREQTRKTATKAAAAKPASKPTATKSRKGIGGRPSKFDTIDLEKVRLLATRGWTDEEMAEFYNVNIATWHRWKDAHPEFCDALKDWKVEADSRVERSLYERATGYSHPEDKIFNDQGTPLVVPTIKHYPPDTTAMIFWLKNRQKEKWRDKQEHDHGFQEDNPITGLLAAITGSTLRPAEPTDPDD